MKTIDVEVLATVSGGKTGDRVSAGAIGGRKVAEGDAAASERGPGGRAARSGELVGRANRGR
jgi:hypothetical protein